VCSGFSADRQNIMENSNRTPGLSVRRRSVALGVALIAAAAVVHVRLAAQDLSQLVSTATPAQATPLVYNHRQITVFRAAVLSRTPAERARAASELIDRIVNDAAPGTASSRPLQGVSILSVGGRDVFAILPLDVDALAGETLESATAAAVGHLQQAVDEAVELRTPRRIATSTAWALLATLIAGALALATRRLHRTLVAGASRTAERKLKQLSAGDVLVKASRAPEVARKAVTTIFIVLWLFIGYSWLTFVLRRFPYTRPWGESLRSFLLDRLVFVGMKILEAIPDLFTVLLILLITRFVVRLSQVMFQAVEEGRLSIPYAYPETAQSTRRLVTALIWLLGLVLAYPYLPGSNSDAFKGMSVFLGVALSLGSSGIVNQIMSGLTITYSRAVRVGDFVKIGDVEGTITQLGTLSTKVKTPRREEVTIPNAVVMGQVTTNYSRFSDTEGVFVPTSLTIGYDTPWRQVQALLLLAAERTPGVRSDPAPVVRRSALQDFYVHYTLLICLESPQQRFATLDTLHANILDAFNEYGVQITSPNYEADPEARKVVPVDQWYAAPARAEAAGGPAAGGPAAR
jgi:small-conductance mechanosensitive channel